MPEAQNTQVALTTGSGEAAFSLFLEVELADSPLALCPRSSGRGTMKYAMPKASVYEQLRSEYIAILFQLKQEGRSHVLATHSVYRLLHWLHLIGLELCIGLFRFLLFRQPRPAFVR